MAWLTPGDPAPWFTVRASNNDSFNFANVAGRHIVLCFFGSAGEPFGAEVLRLAVRNRAIFDDDNISFFGISSDPDDERLERARQIIPGMRYFWDFDRQVARLYGGDAEPGGGAEPAERCSIVLDPNLRVLAVVRETEPKAHMVALYGVLRRLPKIAQERPAALQAPVLVVPRVVEPAMCRQLITLYEAHGGEDSGFMRDVDGKTVGIIDHRHKRRSDWYIDQPSLRQALQERINRRLVPEIEKAFQYRATRMERYIVACYDSEGGGFFRPHRDNTTRGTAHRRFAVTVNLNAEDYQGGELRFPEYGRQTFRAPTGGAVVFSCTLLHEATPVVNGRRYAFLPFLYDDAAAELREANNRFLGENVGAYRSAAGARDRLAPPAEEETRPSA